MKKLLILLFITLTLLIQGCGGSEETVCTATDAQKRGGLIYLPNQQEHLPVKTYVNIRMVRNGKRKITKTVS